MRVCVRACMLVCEYIYRCTSVPHRLASLRIIKLIITIDTEVAIATCVTILIKVYYQVYKGHKHVVFIIQQIIKRCGDHFTYIL